VSGTVPTLAGRPGADAGIVGTSELAARDRKTVATVARLGARLSLWTLAGVAGGLALALVVPLAFGARPLSVLSGSMEPALHTGDLVISKRIAPLDARVGDVVTFRDPNREGQSVTHRVRSVRAQGRKVVFVTKGDANNASERWRISERGKVGRAVYRIPALGRAIGAMRSRTGMLVLLLVLLPLGAWEIAAAWRPERDDA
jgi:signal peptidase